MGPHQTEYCMHNGSPRGEERERERIRKLMQRKNECREIHTETHN